MGLYDDIRDVAGGAASRFADWAVRSDDDVSMLDMNSALAKSGMGIGQPTDEKPRAMFHDPYSVMDWGGWRTRPSSLTYETLRQMSVSNTVIAAIINLRVNQVAQFARPQQGPYDKGYRVVLRDRRDKSRVMTKAELQRATEIERMLETTGFLQPNEKPQDRDSFRAFQKKAVRDILTYDQWCFEKIRDRRGRLSRFIALPSESIRPAVADIEHMEVKQIRDRVSHVQVYENTVISEFSTDDMAWCVMNPRSDLRANGFGFSPIEQIVRLVTAWLFGFEYNTKFFTQGSAIKGLLNIKGSIPDRQMRAFRRMWYTMISGVSNSWKTPILNSEDIQWVNMHSSNREMEFGQWMDWLTKLICAVFGIDPLEINFIFGGSGGGGAMFDRRPNQAEVTESKDRGLRPLVEHITDHVNQHIIWEMEPDFEFSFAGLDAKAEQAERDARLQEVRGVKTVNEIRAEMDEPPLKGEMGNVILDPTWMQWAMQNQPDGDDSEGGGDSPEESRDDGGEEQDLGPTESGEEQQEDLAEGTEDLLAASQTMYRQTMDSLRKSETVGDRQILDIVLSEGD